MRAGVGEAHLTGGRGSIAAQEQAGLAQRPGSGGRREAGRLLQGQREMGTRAQEPTDVVAPESPSLAVTARRESLQDERVTLSPGHHVHPALA